jgi:sugar O-acyltransferase (sialic acid O-acetyltransferase NeuD family)
MNKLILLGGGEHARIVADCLLSSGQNVSAFFDPKYSGNVYGIPQRGDYDPEYEPDALAVIAIGNNQIRKRLSTSTKHKFANAIHASAIISAFVTMGVGNMVLHGSIVQTGTRIGSHVIINTGAQIDHDCVIENFVHVAPGVVLCGTVVVEEGAMIGARAVVIPGKRIGKWSIVGAGAVVIDDVPEYSVVVGNPAKVIKSNIL